MRGRIARGCSRRALSKMPDGRGHRRGADDTAAFGPSTAGTESDRPASPVDLDQFKRAAVELGLVRAEEFEQFVTGAYARWLGTGPRARPRPGAAGRGVQSRRRHGGGTADPIGNVYGARRFHGPRTRHRLVPALGYSNGACGAGELLEREPHLWAAAALMAGAGDPSRVGAAKNVPIWAFHGEKDPTIPLDRMRELFDALRAAHGHPMFTIYPNGVHYHARNGIHDPNLLPWMFAQRRGKPEVPFEKVAKPNDKRPTSLAIKQSTLSHASQRVASRARRV
jgi:hypothetical protein